MIGDEQLPDGKPPVGPNGHSSRLTAAADRHRAWCEILKLVRDEAEAAREDFLVYLVDIAIEHAVSLERASRLGQPEPI